MNSQV
jgi:hypothetical protein